MIDLEELKALCDKATPGPWTSGNPYGLAGIRPDLFGEGRCSFCRDSEPLRTLVGNINGKRMPAHLHRHEGEWTEGITALDDDRGYLNVVIETEEYGLMTDDDREFIVAARTAVPELIAEVERLRGEAS